MSRYPWIFSLSKSLNHNTVCWRGSFFVCPPTTFKQYSRTYSFPELPEHAFARQLSDIANCEIWIITPHNIDLFITNRYEISDDGMLKKVARQINVGQPCANAYMIMPDISINDLMKLLALFTKPHQNKLCFHPSYEKILPKLMFFRLPKVFSNKTFHINFPLCLMLLFHLITDYLLMIQQPLIL